MSGPEELPQAPAPRGDMLKLGAEDLLTPQEVGERAIAMLLECLSPLNTDTETQWAPQLPGNTINLQLPDAPDQGFPVTLNEHADVSFGITMRKLALPIDEFADQFLAPAVSALAEQIDKTMVETGSTKPVFASAPLDIPEGAFAGVHSRDGVSLRVMYQYDLITQQMIVSLDLIFGVASAALASV